MQTHQCLSNLIQWQTDQTGRGWRILQYAALGFDVSVQETLYSLISGSTLYVIPRELRYDMPELSEFLHEKKIEMLTMPFSALNLLFREETEIGSNSYLRHIITSGEALQMFPQLRDYLERHPEVKLHNQYGPTETHVITAYTLSAAQGNITEYPPIGRPVSNTGILILDDQHHPVPISVKGEIYAEGLCLARGYLNHDDLTSEKFIPHPFKEDQRLYRTGDIGRWLPDGNIEFFGRNDDQVKIRGFRIELGEIENRLLQHESVREAVVVARDIRENKELAAYVTGKNGLNVNSLRTHLKSLLPDYMIPSYFVQIKKFPYTPSGKADKNALPDPDTQGMDRGTEYIAPRDETDQTLVDIWQEVLGIENIGIRENFFELGGHSLKATQVVSRIHKKLKAEIALREIFTHPTIEELTDIIRKKQSIHYERIEPVKTIEPANDEELAALKNLMNQSE